jgi:hypothetical protein
MLAASAGGSSAIGFVRTSGEFTLDGANTRDNATVFNGGVVESTTWPTHIVLQDGTRVDLGRDSRSRIFRDHVVLEKGTTQVHGAMQFPVIADSLHIASSEPFRVALGEEHKVKVTALDGSAEVKNARGMLVAMVAGGRTLDFQEAGAAAPANITGCVQKVGTHYVVRDTTTNIVIEVTGENIEQYVGKSVNITGSPDPGATPIDGASQIIRAASIAKGTGKGCKSEIAAAALAGGGVAVGGALSTGAIIAIVGGVAAAGTVGGLAASGAFSSSSSGTAECGQQR